MSDDAYTNRTIAPAEPVKAVGPKGSIDFGGHGYGGHHSLTVLQPGDELELEYLGTSVFGGQIVGARRPGGPWLYRKTDAELETERANMLAGFDRQWRETLEANREVWATREAALLQDGQTRLVYKETIAAKAGEHGELDIPTTITLRLKPYIGGPTYAVLARFRYRLKNQHLVLGYVLDRPDLIRELAFADVVRDLRNGTLTIERDGETVENPNGYEAVPAPIFEGRP